MSNLSTIYLVRHGQTNWNVEGRIQGHKNSVLTNAGRQQAADLAERFSGINFDAVYSSDLTRAKDTAEILAAKRDLAVATTKALRERTQGPLDGRLRAEVREEIGDLLDAYNALPDEERYRARHTKEMESDEACMARFLPFIREAAVGHAGQTVLMVTHGYTMRIFLTRLGYATYGEIGKIDNTAHIRVKSDGVEFTLEEISGVEITRKEEEIAKRTGA